MLNWQNIAVALVVMTAVVYLLYRVYAIFAKRKRPGCGAGCDTCPSIEPSDMTSTGNVVSIERLTATAKQFRPRSPK